MPLTPKRPSEDPHKPIPEKRLVQTRLSFAPRIAPRPAASSESASLVPSSSPYFSVPSSSGSFNSNRRCSGPGALGGSGSSGSDGRGRGSGGIWRGSGGGGRGGLFRNRQWMREDSAGSSTLSGLSLSDPDKSKASGELDEELQTPRKRTAWGARDNKERQAVAKETIELIPEVLEQIPASKQRSVLYDDITPRLNHKYCPGFTLPSTDKEPGRKGCRIRVVDGDTFDTTIGLGKILGDTKGVALLNMANAKHPGGGWRKGSMAQEEELCYRSTLSYALDKSFYPLDEVSAIYSPSVTVFRSSFATGHVLYPSTKPFATLSVVSIAALRDPPLTDDSPPDYANPEDRTVMLDKIRLLLRVAALKGHRRVVLGALGCGAFHNPKEKVVECFLEVFREREFSGGWWRDVVFAVLDTEKEEGKKGKTGSGCFGVFWRGLEGVIA